MRAAQPLRQLGIEHQRLVCARRARLWLFEDRPDGVREPRVGDVDGTRDELVASLVRDPHHGGIDVQLLHQRLGDRGERALERQCLGERA